MHFPLVGPYDEVHTFAAVIVEVALFIFMCTQLALGYEQKSWIELRKKYFRSAHITVIAMIVVAVAGIWTLGFLLLTGFSYAIYKLIQSIPQTYDFKIMKSNEASSSSESRSGF